MRAAVIISATCAQPPFNALMPEDMFAWQRDGLVIYAEGFGTDKASIDRVQLSIDEILHGH
jgi:hypothetical protein